MIDIVTLEKAYRKFNGNLGKYLQDGIISADKTLLKYMEIDSETRIEEDDICNFYLAETDEKITLLNHRFVIWITPKVIMGAPVTLTLISTVYRGEANLEMAFSTSGIYNKPRYILKTIKHFLLDLIETQKVIASMSAS